MDQTPHRRLAFWQLLVIHLALLVGALALVPFGELGVLRWLLAAILLLTASVVGAWTELLYPSGPHTRSHD